VVEYLVEKGADFRANDNDVVRLASANGNLKVVKYLVEKGADFRADDNYAVKIADENCDFEIVMYLVSKGAPANILSDQACAYIQKCNTHWTRMNHFDFSGKTNILFGTLFLGIQRLEQNYTLPLAHQAMLEEMLEVWTFGHEYKIIR
jgi:ankyrin repeat protein